MCHFQNILDLFNSIILHLVHRYVFSQFANHGPGRNLSHIDHIQSVCVRKLQSCYYVSNTQVQARHVHRGIL